MDHLFIFLMGWNICRLFCWFCYLLICAIMH